MSHETSHTTSPNVPSDWPERWRSMAHGVGVGRYIDAGFARLEFERLWSRVWQIAARLDEIPETGDYTVYEIGDQSVLLVRTGPDAVRAHHNFCPHRGTTLAEGHGKFEGGRIICPFHGWRWDLGGTNQYVLEPQEFRGGKLCESDVALRAAHCEVFAGFVFISLAAEPEPFNEFIAPLRQLIEDLAIGDMHHYWWKSAAVPANWKVAQEAFFEAFHVPATHPQLERLGREVIYGDSEDAPFTHRDLTYEVFEQGHGRFYGGSKTPVHGHVPAAQGHPVDEMADRLSLIAEGLDAMVLKEDVDILRALRDKPIPAGSSLGQEYVRALYAHAEGQQRPMPKPTADVLRQWCGPIFIFPNFMILPQAGNAEFYRARPHPTDPDQCIFEIFSTRTLPAGVAPQRASCHHVTDPENELLLIPRQDLGNIPRMQKGLHSRRMRQTWLAENQEKLIINMHRELDRYLQDDTGHAFGNS